MKMADYIDRESTIKALNEFKQNRNNCLECKYRHKINGNCIAVGGFCTAVPAKDCQLLAEYLNTELILSDILSKLPN